MTMLSPRPWVPEAPERYVQSLAERVAGRSADEIERDLIAYVAENRAIHERDCVNLNPGDQRHEPARRGAARRRPRLAALARLSRRQIRDGAGGDREDRGASRPSWRPRSLARAMPRSACRPARSPISTPSWRRQSPATASSRRRRRSAATSRITRRVPPASTAWSRIPRRSIPRATPSMSTRCESRRGDCDRSSSPSVAASTCFRIRSAEIRAIADEVGALVLFDAAHMSGMIAGRAWQQPLEEGAHLMTMSTYKSLGGPPSGLILTNDAAARRAARRHRLSRPDRQFRRGEIGRAGHHAARLEGARPRLCRGDGRNREGACRRRWSSAAFRCSRASAASPRSHQFAIEAAALWRRPGGSETAAPGQHPDLRHRPADRGGRGRRERPAPRHAGDRALGHDARATCRNWRASSPARSG